MQGTADLFAASKKAHTPDLQYLQPASEFFPSNLAEFVSSRSIARCLNMYLL